MSLYTFECFFKQNTGEIAIHTTRTVFKNMVACAVQYLNDHYNPCSPNYVKPSAYTEFQNIFAETNSRFLDSIYYSRMPGCGDALQAHLAVLQQYIEYRNSNVMPIDYDGVLDLMVYLTVYHYHNHTVKCIEITHQQSGKRFGCQMEYQKFDWFAQVEHWRDVFNFGNVVQKLTHVPLPGDNLHYYADGEKPGYEEVWCFEPRTLSEGDYSECKKHVQDIEDYVVLKKIQDRGHLEHMPEFNQLIWATKTLVKLVDGKALSGRKNPEYAVLVLRSEITECGYEIKIYN